MPQVDLETLVSACAGGSCDRKIACETLADGDHPSEEPDKSEIPPDFPPDSFWLSKDAELDWFDRNAFYERKESQKGNSNSTNLNPNIHPNSNSNSNSQRFSSTLKSKASIIGLPKPQKTCFVDSKKRRNCKPGNTRLFPKRSGSVGKSDAPMVEPSSPKVSCMGRVRSKRDRNRRLKNRHKSSEPETAKAKPALSRKPSFLASFRAIFRTGCRQLPVDENDVTYRHSPPRRSAATKTPDIRERLPPGDIDALSRESPARKSVTRKSREDTESEPTAEPVGLGSMKRFASGRKSESLTGIDVV